MSRTQPAARWRGHPHLVNVGYPGSGGERLGRVRAVVVAAVVAAAISIVGLVASQHAAGAATCPGGASTWTGAQSTDWYTAGNWAPAAVPTATTDVCLDIAGTVLISPGDAVAATVTITDPASILRLQAAAATEAALVVGGPVHNGGQIQMHGISGVDAPLTAGSLDNAGLLAVSGGAASVTLTVDHLTNTGEITVTGSNLTIDAASIDSSGDVTTANARQVTLPNAPTTTVTGSIESLTTASFVSFEQDGGSLDLSGATLTAGTHLLPGVDLTVGHAAIGTGPVPTLRVTGGSAHLVGDAAAVLVHLEGTNTLSGTVGVEHEVHVRGIGGPTPAVTTVAGDLTILGELQLRQMGGGAGLARLEVTGEVINSGTLTVDTALHTLVADTFVSSGAMNPGGLRLDARVVEISGTVFSPNTSPELRISSTADAAGPAVSITGLISLPGSSGRYAQEGGTLEVVDGGLAVGAAISLYDVALYAEGSIGRHLDLYGTTVVAPGASTGALNVTDLYRHWDADTVLEVELGGTAPGLGYDQIASGGSARLEGTLAISLVEDFVPAPCDTFDVVSSSGRSGTYDAVTGTGLPGDLQLVPAYSTTGLRLIAGSTAADVQAYPTEMALNATVTSGTYSVCLTRQPSTNVIITPMSGHPGVSVSPAVLEFTSSNWQQPQVVSVSAAFDGEGLPATVDIDHEITTSDTSFGAESVDSILVTLGDDPLAVLTVSKTADVAVAAVGDTITYTVVVTNSGPGVATQVDLVDLLPDGVQLVSATGGCTGVTSTVTCDLGDLAVGQTVERTITIVAAELGVQVNTAIATATAPSATATDVATVEVVLAGEVPPPAAQGPVGGSPVVESPVAGSPVAGSPVVGSPVVGASVGSSPDHSQDPVEVIADGAALPATGTGTASLLLAALLASLVGAAMLHRSSDARGDRWLG